MRASLILICLVFVSVGQTRRNQNAPNNNQLNDDIWTSNQNSSYEYEFGVDDDESLEYGQVSDSTEQPVHTVYSDNSMTAKLRFYHNLFDNYTELGFNDASEILSTSWYNSTRTTVIFAHGYTGHPNGVAVTAVATEHLKLEKFNVVLLNWDQMAAAALSNHANSYLNWATPNSIKVAYAFADVLLEMSKAGLDLNKLHLIGHSLGAHLFGITGNILAEKGILLPWITGLDPARVGFERKPLSMRINPNSARFVAIVHSDPQKYGSRRELGFVDFWPNFRNGPVTQPGCYNKPFPRFSPEDLCNHHRCWQLLCDALRHPGTLMGSWAKNFRSWKNYSQQERKAIVLELGVFNPKATPGNYFFMTTAESPFGLGENGL